VLQSLSDCCCHFHTCVAVLGLFTLISALMCCYRSWPMQRPKTKDLLEHKWVKTAKKTSMLVDLIQQRHPDQGFIQDDPAAESNKK